MSERWRWNEDGDLVDQAGDLVIRGHHFEVVNRYNRQVMAAAPELLAMLEKFADDDAGRIERDEAKALVARVKGTP